MRGVVEMVEYAASAGENLPFRRACAPVMDPTSAREKNQSESN